jgi:predicted dienelactone hydrolase
LLSRDLSRVSSHSWTDADISPQEAMYPIVVLRAGGGAMSSDYTSIAENLASYGYVVVSMDAPYRTVITAFSDGRVAYRNTQGDFDSMPYAAGEKFATQLMRVWIEDVKFILYRLHELNANDPSGRFKGKLDLSDGAWCKSLFPSPRMLPLRLTWISWASVFASSSIPCIQAKRAASPARQ